MQCERNGRDITLTLFRTKEESTGNLSNADKPIGRRKLAAADIIKMWAMAADGAEVISNLRAEDEEEEEEEQEPDLGEQEDDEVQFFGNEGESQLEYFGAPAHEPNNATPNEPEDHYRTLYENAGEEPDFSLFYEAEVSDSEEPSATQEM